MKESKLDNLFQRKLENFERIPSDSAWDKINSNLNQPYNKLIWWKIAAGILLVFSVSLIIYHINHTGKLPKNLTNKAKTPEYQANESGPEKQPTSPFTNNQVTSNEIKPIETYKEKNSEKKTLKDALVQNIYKSEKSEKDQPIRHQDNLDAKKLKKLQPDKHLTKVRGLENKGESPLFQTAGNSKLHKQQELNDVDHFQKVTITYKRSPRPSKENLLAENEKNSLKKILGYAKEIKNGEIGLSNIREAKDEFLAININIKKPNLKGKN